jgi:hypothetical protein
VFAQPFVLHFLRPPHDVASALAASEAVMISSA